MENINRRIYLIRILHNYTQVYVASKLGISATAYTSLEHDASRISISRLVSIIAIYGISISDFFAFTEDDILNIIRNSGKVNKGMDASEYHKIISKLEAVNRVLYRLAESNIDRLNQMGSE